MINTDMTYIWIHIFLYVYFYQILTLFSKLKMIISWHFNMGNNIVWLTECLTSSEQYFSYIHDKFTKNTKGVKRYHFGWDLDWHFISHTKKSGLIRNYFHGNGSPTTIPNINYLSTFYFAMNRMSGFKLDFLKIKIIWKTNFV